MFSRLTVFVSFISLHVQQRMIKLNRGAATPELFDRYSKALDTAVTLATMQNVKPVPGKTLVICEVRERVGLSVGLVYGCGL